MEWLGSQTGLKVSLQAPSPALSSSKEVKLLERALVGRLPEL